MPTNPNEPLRRLIPPPRRPPSVLAIIVRWRIELALCTAVGTAWLEFGTEIMGFGLLALLIILAFCRPARVLFGRLERTDIVPHRVRSGLVEAGVTSRSGRPPLLVWARPLGDGVLVYIWLRSGTTVSDVVDALPVIAGACGAARVEVFTPPLRPDRVVLAVHNPRWGRWR